MGRELTGGWSVATKKHVKSYHRLPEGVRREIIRRVAGGALHRDIARDLGVSPQVVSTIVGPMGYVFRVEDWRTSRSRLSLEDRVEIALGRQRGESLRCIATRLGRHPSTISREVRRGRVDRKHGYRPVGAHKLAYQRARRPKPTKLSSNPRLQDRVVADLNAFWSPEQIARRLRQDFGDDMQMQISHETIYKSLYVQGRGELRRELTRCLRTGRAKRRPRGWGGSRRKIPDMVMISERPAEAEDRAVPGHWEGDLVMGRDSKSAIGTLVERSTRYVMLLHLPVDHTAPSVRDAMAQVITTLPESLRRSVTWDQGPEMAQHVQFTVDTGVPVYFCDPYKPWQRGSNENTNGLLRQYFPKGTDLSVHGPQKLQEVADSLNTRPRKTLEWRTPAEKFAEVVATIT